MHTMHGSNENQSHKNFSLKVDTCNTVPFQAQRIEGSDCLFPVCHHERCELHFQGCPHPVSPKLKVQVLRGETKT